MNKIKLVIKREYLTRVRKKSFLIMTFLSPLFFGLLMIVPTLIALSSSSDEKLIAVIDEVGVYEQNLENIAGIKFEFLEHNLEKELRENFSITEYYAFLSIKKDTVSNEDVFRLISDNQIVIDVRDYVKGELRRVLIDKKLHSYEIEELDKIVKELSDVQVALTTVKIDDLGGEKESAVEISMEISMLFAFISYFVIFIYGNQVMRGVSEEKSSRIVEVIISSIKPFQLMMGKIVGIALVALTQFVLWIILTFGIVSIAQSVIPSTFEQDNLVEMIENGESNEFISEEAMSDFDFHQILSSVKEQNIGQMLFIFILYFIGGYFLYASFFAAVGSAVDAETDSQQFVLPITIPVIIGLYIAMFAFKAPHSPLAVWASMIPLTSPMVMLARLPFDVPMWEIIVSLIILAASFILSTWFAARIYRTGILMYGKKVTYKELWKWFKYSRK